MTSNTIEQVAGEDTESEPITAEQARAAAMRRDLNTARAHVRNLEVSNGELQRIVDLFGKVEGADPHPPKWLSPKAPRGQHRATLTLMLSDTHFDEVARPEELGGMNAYNRAIATMRLEAWAEGVIKLSRHYLSGVKWDGVVLMLGGDIFSGNIHDELVETNEDTLFGSLLYWSEQIAAAIEMLASEFGKVHVPVVVGNHPRLTKKMRYKLVARDNLDWLLGQILAREFKTDRRVTFQIPEETDAYFELYGRGLLLNHGITNGGSGIGGIWPPIMRLRARKASLYMPMNKPFDTLYIGHWHQFIPTPSLVVNGALKGWDEYARDHAFPFDEPKQYMGVVTPEHGTTWQVPVFCMNRAKEGW